MSFLKSFGFAWQGVVLGAKGRNFRVMLAIATGTVVLGWFLGLSRMEWALVLGCSGLVLGLELVNTAGERLVDLVCPEQDDRFGQVKDLLAGAVLLAATFSAGVGLLIFWSRILP